WDASPEQKKQCLQTECFNHIRFLQRYNETHLYACGTNAFRPLCAFVDSERFGLPASFEDGRDRCPYDPAKGYTGLLAGEMFTASQYEFRSSPDVRRNFPFPTLRTEEAPTRWLLADFVGSALLRESVNSSVGDDDKIYFFFTERSQEQMAYPSRTKVSRVARVCKLQTDWGGQRTLQRKWTSFLKARLVCFVPEYELYLNVLRGVFVMRGSDAQSSFLYGVFGLEKNIKASAICRYAFSDVQKAFDGPYMEVQDSKWREYTGKVPEPRPGSCITDEHRSRGINSSRDLPDGVLTFARRHPLMAIQVRPAGARPLMFKRSVNYVRIAAHQQPALDGNVYTVLFLGTDGWLHRAVDIGGEMHIMEELQLFDQGQPIESMVLAPALRHVYVGSHSGVVQIPMSACRRYASCYDCVFARDPFCGWDGRRSNLTQDIQRGTSGCKENSGNVHRRRSVMAGDDVLLQCELRSNLAMPRWTLDGRELRGYGVDSGYRVGTDGLLIIGARGRQSGSYRCFAVENSVSVLVYLYTLAAPLPAGPQLHAYRHMEAVYICLVAVLGGLCLVLSVVLLYVSFCTRRVSRSRKFSQQQGLHILGSSERKGSSHVELQTISNGRQGRRSISVPAFGDFLQIVPGEGSPTTGTPPAAPPLPLPPPLPDADYANGMSATLPSVLRKMNGNSYVLLRQVDHDGASPLYHSFTEELNRILEQRKHTQLDLQPHES
uniref:Semaphorin 4G n=1 Tax=Hippocampus comes TaxID=109280 RepID=A0A3Q2YY31_HIPCM